MEESKRVCYFSYNKVSLIFVKFVMNVVALFFLLIIIFDFKFVLFTYSFFHSKHRTKWKEIKTEESFFQTILHLTMDSRIHSI